MTERPVVQTPPEPAPDQQPEPPPPEPPAEPEREIKCTLCGLRACWT